MRAWFFYEVLEKLLSKDGQHLKFQRSGWNGKGMWIELQRPDENSKMTLPYIFMHTADGDLIPWVVSHSDMLKCDWSLA